MEHRLGRVSLRGAGKPQAASESCHLLSVIVLVRHLAQDYELTLRVDTGFVRATSQKVHRRGAKLLIAGSGCESPPARHRRGSVPLWLGSEAAGALATSAAVPGDSALLRAPADRAGEDAVLVRIPLVFPALGPFASTDGRGHAAPAANTTQQLEDGPSAGGQHNRRSFHACTVQRKAAPSHAVKTKKRSAAFLSANRAAAVESVQAATTTNGSGPSDITVVGTFAESSHCHLVEEQRKRRQVSGGS
jgi:hypothetical protein